MRLIGLLLILTACFGSQDSEMVRHYFVAQTVPDTEEKSQKDQVVTASKPSKPLLT